MALRFKRVHRRIYKTSIASLAAYTSAVSSSPVYSAPKKQPGETKIVCVMGDYWHPAISQETHVRQIFSRNENYKVYFVMASRYLTAELLSDADLFISARYGGSDSIGWSPDPIIVERPRPDRIWTDEQVDVLIDNVTNRGMGWIAAHLQSPTAGNVSKSLWASFRFCIRKSSRLALTTLIRNVHNQRHRTVFH